MRTKHRTAELALGHGIHPGLSVAGAQQFRLPAIHVAPEDHVVGGNAFIHRTW